VEAIAIHSYLSWYRRNTNVSDFWTTHTSNLGANPRWAFGLGFAIQAVPGGEGLVSVRLAAQAAEAEFVLEQAQAAEEEFVLEQAQAAEEEFVLEPVVWAEHSAWEAAGVSFLRELIHDVAVEALWKAKLDSLEGVLVVVLAVLAEVDEACFAG
jgi:hypothetical protein